MKTATQNTLCDITGQKTGIVVMDKQVMAVNWYEESPDGGVPVMSPVGTPVSITAEGGIQVLSEERVEDIRRALPGRIVSEGKNDEGIHQIKAEDMEIKYDEFHQIPALWGFDLQKGACPTRGANGDATPTGGTVYRIRCGEHEAAVIAPDGWE
ncbi:MAG TPA: hypothetical protein GXZ77_00575 [Papillibacter sp.]|nr:hypothetical protein [Papillibacter sp.]